MNRLYQVTILPAQARYLASLQELLGCAVGVAQEGSTLTIFTGAQDQPHISINARGEPLDPETKERIPC